MLRPSCANPQVSIEQTGPRLLTVLAGAQFGHSVALKKPNFIPLLKHSLSSSTYNYNQFNLNFLIVSNQLKKYKNTNTFACRINEIWQLSLQQLSKVLRVTQ